MEQYKNTLIYASIGYAAGKYVVRYTPFERCTPESFWGLAGAATGYLVDSGYILNNENPKRADNRTYSTIDNSTKLTDGSHF